MTTMPSDFNHAVSEWQRSAVALVDVAEAAAPLAPAEFDRPSFEFGLTAGPEGEVLDEAGFDARIEELITKSDRVIAEIWTAAGAPIGSAADNQPDASATADDASQLTEDDEQGASATVDKASQLAQDVVANRAAAGSAPVLLGSLEVGRALLAASLEPAEAIVEFGLAPDEPIRLSETREVLGELAAGLKGAATAAVELPEKLTEKLDELQDKAVAELLAIGADVVLQAGLGSLAANAISHAPAVIQRAFDAARGTISWLKSGALKLLKWIVEKVNDLLPDRLKDKFDTWVDRLKDGVKDQVIDRLGDLVGELFGRDDVERAWEAARRAGHDVSDAESRLDAVISGHLKRIGYAGIGRTSAAAVSGVFVMAVPPVAPYIQLVMGTFAALLIALVCSQVWDGFNDIERLAMPG